MVQVGFQYLEIAPGFVTSPPLRTRIRRHRPSEIGLSAIVTYELYYGALELLCSDGVRRTGVTCALLMYDESREIPRGKRVDIPEVPDEVEM